jgi:hypothetical protein
MVTSSSSVDNHPDNHQAIADEIEHIHREIGTSYVTIIWHFIQEQIPSIDSWSAENTA